MGVGFGYNNAINHETIVTVSSPLNLDKVKYILDRDKFSFYIATDENLDSLPTTVIFEFFIGGIEFPRPIDLFFLTGINAIDFTLQYWDGSDWSGPWYTGSFTPPNPLLRPSLTTTSKIKLTLAATDPSNTAKVIYGAWMGLMAVEIPNELVEYKPTTRLSHQEMKFGDGSLSRSMVKNSLYRSEKWEANIKLQHVSAADLAKLIALKESGDTIIFIPEIRHNSFDDRTIEEFFICHWTGPLAYKYVSSYIGAGYDLEIQLKEV